MIPVAVGGLPKIRTSCSLLDLLFTRRGPSCRLTHSGAWDFVACRCIGALAACLAGLFSFFFSLLILLLSFFFFFFVSVLFGDGDGGVRI